MLLCVLAITIMNDLSPPSLSLSLSPSLPLPLYDTSALQSVC